MNSEVQAQASGIVELVDVGQYVPGIGWLTFKWPKGAPMPRICVSPVVAAESAVVPVKPFHGVTLPTFVNQRRPSTVTVNGQARKLSACVAILLDARRRGERTLRARPDTLRRLAVELPEFASFVRRVGKCTGGMIAVSIEGEWVG